MAFLDKSEPISPKKPADDRAEIELNPFPGDPPGPAGPIEIEEAADSVSPHTGVFSPGGARSEMLYYVEGDFLHEAAYDILGGVAPAVGIGAGKLDRKLPRCHPQRPREFATQIQWRGVGMYGGDRGLEAQFHGARTLDPDIPAVRDDFVFYPSYDFLVSFEAPPYTVLHNDSIDLRQGLWADDDGFQGTFAYATEWLRFCDFPIEDASEFIQFRLGQMAFRTGDLEPPGVEPGKPPTPFAGLIRIPWPKDLLKIRWHQVPWSYCQHPDFYPRKFKWRVNQNPWLGYEPGELLLAGYQFLDRRNPFYADQDVFGVDDVSTDKLVDVEIHLLISRAEAPVPPVPANANWIAHGHNLMPWAVDRRFHYVTAVGTSGGLYSRDADIDETNWVPLYRSAPFELLLTDPTLAQPLFGAFRV